MRKVTSTLIFVLLGLTTAVVVVSLLLTLFLPTLLRRFACAPYGIRCAAGQAKIHLHLNLITDLVIHNLTVFEQDGRGVVLQAKRLAVTLDLPKLILTRRVMPTEVRIDSPELLLRQLDDGRWNLLALAQEVRKHWRPTTRVSPVQIPSISIHAGAVQIGARRVTDLNLSLEPKPAPQLFGVQVRAAVEGRPIQVTGVVSESLEGEVQVQGPEITLAKAARSWKPRAALRLRLDLTAHSLNISEWTLEDEGAMARGTAAIRYAEWPLAYEMTVGAWRADLSKVADKVPLPQVSDLNGQVQGEPVTLQGHWPKLPVASVTATLSGVGFQVSKQAFQVMGLTGVCRLHYTGTRLGAQADLHVQTLEVLGERHANAAFHAVLSANPRNGDVTVEELRASIAGARIRAKGSGSQWGRNALDLTTTELIVDPGILTRLFHRAKVGVAIKAVHDPSIHFGWPGENRPWNVEIAGRLIQLALPASGHAISLQETNMAIQGVGTSWRDLQGTIGSRQAEVAGRQLSKLTARFEIHPERVQVPELRFAIAGGSVQGHASLSRPSPLSDLRVALSAKGLRVKQLIPSIEKPTDLLGIAVDAEVSAAISDGRVLATIDLPPAVTGQLLRLIHQPGQTFPDNTGDGHLILRAQGTLQTAKGLQASGSLRVQGLHLLLTGGGPGDREPPLDFSLSYRDGLFSLKGQELRFTAAELTPLLTRLAGRRILAREGNVVMSADVTFGASRPASGTGEIALRGLALDQARNGAAPIPLLRGLQGSVAFRLDKRLLAIKETTLRANGGLNFIVQGSLPLGGNGPATPRFRLTIPSTDTSPLLPSLAALSPALFADARVTGQVRANLEIIGQEYNGEVVLQSVNMGSDHLRLDGVNGVIPLTGRIGQTSATDRASGLEKIGWSRLSEAEYDSALERWRKRPTQNQGSTSLTITSLRYGPIELRDFEATLAPSGDQIAIQRFAFQVWGGRVSGWGTVQPLSGGVALALLIDGLSLRAICDAFPPIKGYISGRVNGLADLSISQFALDKTQGKARFWAVDSPRERREISRALIEKLAGQSIRYFSLIGQDRRYDRGVLDVALKHGDLVFHELDISHTTLVIKDLDIKVSPTFNKIGAAHLLESVRTAIERVTAKSKPQP